MFNYETIQNFLRRDSTESQVKAIEQAKDILKKYECFSKLLNGMSIAVVVALIPNALLGEVLKLLIPSIPLFFNRTPS